MNLCVPHRKIPFLTIFKIGENNIMKCHKSCLPNRNPGPL